MMTMFLGVNASVWYINMVQDHDENIYIYNSYVFKHDIFPNGYAIRLECSRSSRSLNLGKCNCQNTSGTF